MESLREYLFISNTCSADEYVRVQSMKHSERLNPSQKFFSLLIDGVLHSVNCRITHITSRSIAPSNSDRKFLKRIIELCGTNLTFIYTPVINLKIIKNIVNFWSGFFETILFLKRNPKAKTIVFDPLAYDLSLGAILAVKNNPNIKKIAIVTDLPYYLEAINKSNKTSPISKIKSFIRKHISNAIISSMDAYCFLVESMNIINSHKKPYIIIEGFVPHDVRGPVKYTSVDKSVIYAGGLYPKFGIDKLVDAAHEVRDESFRMIFYGEGKSVDYINQIHKLDSRIKYGGMLSLSEIVNVEQSALFLINPRPSHEDFTQYSFPSKTLEYLSSGRPVLTTKLSGIPNEYFDYLYTIEDETVDGIKASIENLLKMDLETLNEKGRKGFNYVIDNKTNLVQGKRLVDFIESLH